MNAQDTLETDIIRDFYPKFEETMDRYLRDPRCRKVYVHCQAGMNRSAALAIAYVHRRFGIPMMKLIESTVRQRPCILTNTSFQRQLVEFASHPKK
jgi:protein-tyrosine phosphatase